MTDTPPTEPTESSSSPTPTPAAGEGAVALVAATPHVPFILVSPSMKIGPTAAALVDLKCSANNIAHEVDQDSNDYETFCGAYRTYGVAHHTLTLTVLQNFDADGPWHTLYPLRGTVADFELLPDDRIAMGPTNPKMSGKAFVPIMPFIDAAVNEASEIEVELAIQGEPTFTEA